MFYYYNPETDTVTTTPPTTPDYTTYETEPHLIEFVHELENHDLIDTWEIGSAFPSYEEGILSLAQDLHQGNDLVDFLFYCRNNAEDYGLDTDPECIALLNKLANYAITRD